MPCAPLERNCLHRLLLLLPACLSFAVGGDSFAHSWPGGRVVRSVTDGERSFQRGWPRPRVPDWPPYCLHCQVEGLRSGGVGAAGKASNTKIWHSPMPDRFDLAREGVQHCGDFSRKKRCGWASKIHVRAGQPMAQAQAGHVLGLRQVDRLDDRMDPSICGIELAA